jgi:Sap, sulfolipid-1-addressing protein
LPLAVLCALSPWAIVAVILMLASDRPSNAVWWLAGWTLSTFVVGAVIIVFFNGFDYSKPSTPRTIACVVQVLLGLLLLVAAVRFWSRRPARSGRLPEEPGWMARIGRMRPIWAFLVGAFWINTAIVVAAAVDTLRAEPRSAEALGVFAAFALVTGAVQGALILYSRLRPEHAADDLTRIREWVTRNQNVGLAVIALALAVYLVGKGISGLRE